MIVDQDLLKLLRSNTLFKSVSETLIKPFIKPKNFLLVEEGEIIFTAGENTTYLFLIVEGEVKVKFKENGMVEYKYLSDFFGEAEILSKSKRKSSAVANTNCVLNRISLEEINRLTKLDGKIKNNLYKTEEVRNNGQKKFNENEFKPPMEIDDDVEENEFLDTEGIKEEESFEELSDEELDNIVEKQKSKHQSEDIVDGIDSLTGDNTLKQILPDKSDNNLLERNFSEDD